MENYKVTKRLGEGAHGFVLKAVHVPSGKDVAIKKLLQRVNYCRDNNLIYNLREIQTMQQVNHEHIVKLLDIIEIPTGIGLVMEYMPTNLNTILYDADRKISPGLVKAYFMMIALGLEYMHKKNIMHRDLKPANLLISAKNILKIADFGLARVFKKTDRLYSHQVATRWYRAPELLWGTRNYTEAIDTWSAGCILGELVTRSPLFPGISDIDQLSVVIRVLGNPSPTKWPEMVELPDFNKITFPNSNGMSWNEIIPGGSPDLLDLISKLLEFNPDNRPTATECLSHSFLWSNPLPLRLDELPSPFKNKKINKDRVSMEQFNILQEYSKY